MVGEPITVQDLLDRLTGDGTEPCEVQLVLETAQGSFWVSDATRAQSLVGEEEVKVLTLRGTQRL